MNAFILSKNIANFSLRSRNCSFLLYKNGIFIENANLIHNKSSFNKTKDFLFSNSKRQLIFLFSKKTFKSCPSYHLQVRKSNENENSKTILSPTVDYRNHANDDQISTHVKPTEKGYFFLFSFLKPPKIINALPCFNFKIAKRVVKDTSYGLIIVIGGMLLAAMFYYLFTELFSRETPSGLYNESSKICINDFEVKDALGTPIKVTAESGGRRVFQIK